MAKEKVEDRPPVTTVPGPLAPPPAPLGTEMEKQQADSRPTVADPTTTLQSSGGIVQPPRPDMTTQGQRPNVGGSAPQSTHPDRPDISGVKEFPEGVPEEPSLVQARQRAEKSGGNVYRVAKTLTTGHTGHVTESDFINSEGKATGDLEWMLRQGALEPIGELKADPRSAHGLGPDGLKRIDEIQARCNELEAENERLTKENETLRADNKRIRDKAGL